MTHVNLIIATPGNSVMTGYLTSLLHVIRELDSRGITWAFSQEFSSHVAHARELTINGDNMISLEETDPFHGKITYDKILWIDSDIRFTPEDVLKAYGSKYDVLTGAYLLANGESVMYRKIGEKPLIIDEILEMTEPEQIEAAGMGFFCMKSGIVESMSRPWFQSVATSKTIEGKEYNFNIVGEDISFCKRIIDLGFEIWLDPSIKLIHHKTLKLTWEGIQI